eukprot:SAG31_NODE_21277_length_553_cov_1.112335_1_plen_67_part_10
MFGTERCGSDTGDRQQQLASLWAAAAAAGKAGLPLALNLGASATSSCGAERLQPTSESSLSLEVAEG